MIFSMNQKLTRTDVCKIQQCKTTAISNSNCDFFSSQIVHFEKVRHVSLYTFWWWFFSWVDVFKDQIFFLSLRKCLSGDEVINSHHLVYNLKVFAGNSRQNFNHKLKKTNLLFHVSKLSKFRIEWIKNF